MTCASCCGSPSSTIERAAPAIATASASATWPASSTNSTSTEPRISSRAHSHGVPAISPTPSPDGGNAALSVEDAMCMLAYTDSGLPALAFFRPTNASPCSSAAASISSSSFPIALCEVAATPTRRPSRSSPQTRRAPVYVLPDPGGPWMNRAPEPSAPTCSASEPAPSAGGRRRSRSHATSSPSPSSITRAASARSAAICAFSFFDYILRLFIAWPYTL